MLGASVTVLVDSFSDLNKLRVFKVEMYIKEANMTVTSNKYANHVAKRH